VVEAAKQAVICIDQAAVSGLADALTSTRERARRFAAQRLAAIAAQISPVQTRPLNVLKGALTSYEALTTPGAEPFDKLRAALSSEDEQVRIAAAVILGKMTTARQPP
jgi:HEAT repeat protein